MCSTTHLHLVEFASMSQTSISATFWPSIQRQQSACKMFHVPFLWVALHSNKLPEFTRISIAIPPHSGIHHLKCCFCHSGMIDSRIENNAYGYYVNRSIVLWDVEPGDAYHWHEHWHDDNILQSHFAEIGNSME